MWDLGQLVVLLSRVTNINMITFVGCKEDNIDAIRDIMFKPGKFTEAINERLIALEVLDRPPQRIVNHERHPFVSIQTEIPNVRAGYLYLLVCVTEPYLAYVGHTGRSLILRLREHNSGAGSIFTRGKAWALYAYACNFPTIPGITNKEMREKMEKEIHFRMRRNFWPWEVKHALISAITQFNVRKGANCIVHVTGNIDEHRIRQISRTRQIEPHIYSDPPQNPMA
jgi:predicted GIY-YIG superfamily endonuclease